MHGGVLLPARLPQVMAEAVRGVHERRFAGPEVLQLVEGLRGVTALVAPSRTGTAHAFGREVQHGKPLHGPLDFHGAGRSIDPAITQPVLILGRDALLLDEIGKKRALAGLDAVVPLASRDRGTYGARVAKGMRRAGALPALVTGAAAAGSSSAEQVGVGIVDDQVGEVVGVEHDDLWGLGKWQMVARVGRGQFPTCFSTGSYWPGMKVNHVGWTLVRLGGGQIRFEDGLKPIPH